MRYLRPELDRPRVRERIQFRGGIPLPCKNGKFVLVDYRKAERLSTDFPYSDITYELIQMVKWLQKNPDKQPEHDKWIVGSMINNWLERSELFYKHQVRIEKAKEMG